MPPCVELRLETTRRRSSRHGHRYPSRTQPALLCNTRLPCRGTTRARFQVRQAHGGGQDAQASRCPNNLKTSESGRPSFVSPYRHVIRIRAKIVLLAFRGLRRRCHRRAARYTAAERQQARPPLQAAASGACVDLLSRSQQTSGRTPAVTPRWLLRGTSRVSCWSFSRGRASGRGSRRPECQVEYVERQKQLRPHARGHLDRRRRPDERSRHRNVDTRRFTGQNGNARRMVSGKVSGRMDWRLESGHFWQQGRVFRYVERRRSAQDRRAVCRSL